MMDSVVMFEGTIYEQGYGLIARSVMRDKNLKPAAKAIYSYICSFASNGSSSERVAFPSVELQLDELGMTRDTYYRHRKSLVEAGYLKIEKVRSSDGTYEKNVYKVLAVPAPVEPHPKNSAMEYPCPKKSTTENLDTKSNSFKNDDDELINKRRENLKKSENYQNLKKFLLEKGFTARKSESIINRLAAEKVPSFEVVPPIMKMALEFYYEGQQRSVVSSVPAFFFSQFEKAVSHFLLEKNMTAEKLAEAEKLALSGRPVPFYNWLEDDQGEVRS
jgi:DNA-binding transcriptional ArsR family regulator